MMKKQIGKALNKGLFLAPMLAYTDMAMRKICYDYCADYTFTEMVSAHAIFEGKTRLIDTIDSKVPTGIQVFTSKAEYLKKAILVLNELIKKKPYKNISSICLNLGCPHVKGSGAFLLNDLEEIEKMFIVLKKHSKLPICAKIRLGIKKKNYKKLVKLSNKYLDFLIVHGRTKEQLYRGENDLDAIKEIKKLSKIPIVANGDVKDIESAKKMFEYTNCDAIMIGRSALEKPWIFKEINAWKSKMSGTIHRGSRKKIDDKTEREKTIKKYLVLAEKYNTSVVHLKNHLMKLLPTKERELKDELSRCKSLEEIKKLF